MPKCQADDPQQSQIRVSYTTQTLIGTPKVRVIGLLMLKNSSFDWYRKMGRVKAPENLQWNWYKERGHVRPIQRWEVLSSVWATVAGIKV